MKNIRPCIDRFLKKDLGWRVLQVSFILPTEEDAKFYGNATILDRSDVVLMRYLGRCVMGAILDHPDVEARARKIQAVFTDL